MKRILILGAASDQVPLILCSKELGYFVIVCDRTTTNPGLKYVDKHYQIDYMDRERVLQIAIDESIDGIVSNSEIVMQHVAYISEKLHLRGNSLDSIRSIGEKNLFRKLQRRAGVYFPKQVDVNSADAAAMAIKEMTLPVLIKPCRNSASRGIVRIDSYEAEVVRKAFECCIQDSWNQEASMEEFVEMPSMMIIEGDIFVYDDVILWDGLFNNLRSPQAPMVPMTDISPLTLSKEKEKAMKDTVSRIIQEAGIKFGAFNIEMYFTKNNQLFVIEVNTRQGGVGVPKYIKDFTGLDYSKLLVSLAVNDYSYCNQLEQNRYVKFKNITRHVVFGRKSGVLKGLVISDKIKKHLLKIEMCMDIGDSVSSCNNGTDAIARIDFSFDSNEQQLLFTHSIEDNVYAVVE